VQDAVCAANMLAEPLARGENVDALLHKVQRRRMLPTRVVQRVQTLAHARFLTPLLAGKQRQPKAPAILRLLDSVPTLRRLPVRLIGFGFRREHLTAPEAAG